MAKTTTKDIDEALSAEDVPTVDAVLMNSIAGIDVLPVGSTNKFLNLLIYGEPGIGKTVLAGSAAAVEDMAPVLFIDIEGGTLSLVDFYPDAKVVRVSSWKELQQVYNALYKGDTGYKTVVIDSLTEAQKFSMGDIMKQAVREDPSRDPDVPAIRDWGKNIEQMRRLVRGFRDLPMHVVFTALADSDKDNRGRMQYRPMLSGKLKGEIPGFVDIVLYMYIKIQGDNQKRLLLTGTTDGAMAKDRSNKLPPIVEDPTMELIYSTVTGTAVTPNE